jgi:hypothetical protein
MIRDQRKSNEHLTPSEFRVMLDVQMRLVQLDAERGIKSIPKLIEAVEVWGTMRKIFAARSAPDVEGQRRCARIEKLFDRGFPAERGQHVD